MPKFLSLGHRRFWECKVEEQSHGRFSAAEFCRLQGMPITSFYSWRRKIRLAEFKALENSCCIAKNHSAKNHPGKNISENLHLNNAQRYNTVLRIESPPAFSFVEFVIGGTL